MTATALGVVPISLTSYVQRIDVTVVRGEPFTVDLDASTGVFDDDVVTAVLTDAMSDIEIPLDVTQSSTEIQVTFAAEKTEGLRLGRGWHWRVMTGEVEKATWLAGSVNLVVP